MIEEQVLMGRLRDLAKELSFIPYELFGGHEMAERKVVGFGSEELFGYPGQFPVTKFKNYWSDDTKSYQGINCNLESASGVVFEVQFHTPISFDTKNEKKHIRSWKSPANKRDFFMLAILLQP